MSEQDFFPLNEGAIVDCTEALKLDPKYANAFGVRADAKFRLGDNEGAIVDCTEALKVDPRCMKAFAVRAYAKLRLGDNELRDYIKKVFGHHDTVFEYLRTGVMPSEDSYPWYEG